MGLSAIHFRLFAIFIFTLFYIFIYNLIIIYTSIQIKMILILKPIFLFQNFKATHHFSKHQAERGSSGQHPWISV